MAQSAESDVELIDRVKNGDEGAIAALYGRYAVGAYSLALRICGDHQHAEEAVQNAFLALWRGAAGFDANRASVPTWLFTIVRNRAIDMVRHAARRAVELVPELTTAGDGDVAEAAADHVLAERVRVALQDLPVANRQVIELIYYGGLTHSEAAGRLGLPLGTVKSRIRSALRQLAQKVGGGESLGAL